MHRSQDSSRDQDLYQTPDPWITELQKSQNCTEIFTVCSVERNPEVFFGASVKKNLMR
jgi:hypothetical protein